MKKTWMLDTNICSFIMREQPVRPEAPGAGGAAR
jgi:predicted nucleic acid-binding protein